MRIYFELQRLHQAGDLFGRQTCLLDGFIIFMFQSDKESSPFN